jgi:hypothetical protein
VITLAKKEVKMPPRILDIPNHFWAKVDIKGPDECWPWEAGKMHFGHGSYAVYRKGIPAHRMAYKLAKGEMKSDQVVCHKCDNPPCCNPNHLFLGTKADNTLDRDRKNRQARGERCGNSKLTLSQVQEIRELYATGQYTHEALSKTYRCSDRNISDIVRFRTWK